MKMLNRLYSLPIQRDTSKSFERNGNVNLRCSCRFCAPNSPTNILIDYHTNEQSPSAFTIRGATMEKLIEYLTHHQFLHPRFVKSFLMTYKSYCTPLQLLDLLIERYHIPEPASADLCTEQQLKKFRKEYVQPVKLR